MGLILPPPQDDHSAFGALSLSSATRPHSSTLLTDRQFVIPPEVLLNRPRVEGITIDDLRLNALGFVKSPDRDDAIGLRTDGAGWIVDVTISDIEWLVKKGTDLAELGLSRGVTNYRRFPYDHVFPTVLAEDIFALGADRERPSITVSIPFARKFEPGRPEIFLSRFQATEQLDFGDVGSRIKLGSDRTLLALFNAAHALSVRRNESGSEFANALSHGLVQNEDGRRVYFDLQRAIGSFIVQEFMIATNQFVAGEMVEKDIPGLFRNQGVLSEWNLQGPLGKLVNGIKRRAHYSPECLGHQALGVDHYTHFTSPIRRFTDAIVQSNFKAFLEGTPFPYPKDELREIAARQTELAILSRFPRLWRSLQSPSEQQSTTELSPNSQFGSAQRPARGAPTRDVLSLSEADVRTCIKDQNLSLPEIVQIFFHSPKDDPFWTEIRKELAFVVLDKGRRLVPAILIEGENGGFISRVRSKEVYSHDGSTRTRIVISSGANEYVGVARNEDEALRRAFIKLFFEDAPWSRAERKEGPQPEPYQFPSRRVKTPHKTNSGLKQQVNISELEDFVASAEERDIFDFLQSHSVHYPCNYTEMLKEGESIKCWGKVRLLYDKYKFFGDDCLIRVTSSAKIGGKDGYTLSSHGYGLDQKSAAMSASYSLLRKIHEGRHLEMAPEYLDLLGLGTS